MWHEGVGRSFFQKAQQSQREGTRALPLALALAATLPYGHKTLLTMIP